MNQVVRQVSSVVAVGLSALALGCGGSGGRSGGGAGASAAAVGSELPIVQTTVALPGAVVGHTATVTSATKEGSALVVVAGGRAEGGVPTGHTSLIDLATGRATPAAGRLNDARADHGASTLADGRVVVFGGTAVDGSALNTIEIFDVARGTWERHPEPTSWPRSKAVAVAVESHLFVASADQQLVEVRNRATLENLGGFQLTAEPGEGFQMLAVGPSHVVVIGKSHVSYLQLEPRHMWELPADALPREASATTVTYQGGGAVMLVGGVRADGLPAQRAGLLLWQSATVEETGPAFDAGRRPTICGLWDGSLLVAGGRAADGTPLSTVQVVGESVRALAPLAEARSDMAAATQGATALLIGGRAAADRATAVVDVVGAAALGSADAAFAEARALRDARRAREAELVRLEGELAAARAEAQRLDGELQQTEQALAGERDRVQKRSAELSQAEGELAAARAQEQALSARLAQEESQVRGLESSIGTNAQQTVAARAARDQAGLDLAAARDAAGRRQGEVSKLESDVAAAQAEATRLTGTTQTLRQQVTDARAAAAAAAAAAARPTTGASSSSAPSGASATRAAAPTRTATIANQHRPIGFLDTVGAGRNQITGWAFDRDTPGQALQIHFYFDGPSDKSNIVFTTTANAPRPDVERFYGITGHHGYVFSCPEVVKNGMTRTLFAYGIDSSGQDTNSLLTGSGKMFVAR